MSKKETDRPGTDRRSILRSLGAAAAGASVIGGFAAGSAMADEPEADEGPDGIDCWYEYECRGHDLYRRMCCDEGGYVTCDDEWEYVGPIC